MWQAFVLFKPDSVSDPQSAKISLEKSYFLALFMITEFAAPPPFLFQYQLRPGRAQAPRGT